MQLVLTNNRLKNLAVRLTILSMTSCWLIMAQYCEALYRHFPESCSSSGEPLPAADIHVVLTSCDVALRCLAGLGSSGDAAEAGELELAGQ